MRGPPVAGTRQAHVLPLQRASHRCRHHTAHSRPLEQAQRAGQAPCWAIEKRALQVPVASGARSAADKAGAAVSRLLDANASEADESAAGLRQGKDQQHGVADWLLDPAPYIMLRDGFSKNGEDVRVLQMLVHDSVIRPTHGDAAGGGRREGDGSVGPGGVSSAGGWAARGALVETNRAAFVEIGLPWDGCCPRSPSILRASMLSRARSLLQVSVRK